MGRYLEEEGRDKPQSRPGQRLPSWPPPSVTDQHELKCSVFCFETLLLIGVLPCLRRHRGDEENGVGEAWLPKTLAWREKAVCALAGSFLSGFLMALRILSFSANRNQIVTFAFRDKEEWLYWCGAAPECTLKVAWLCLWWDAWLVSWLCVGRTCCPPSYTPGRAWVQVLGHVYFGCWDLLNVDNQNEEGLCGGELGVGVGRFQCPPRFSGKLTMFSMTRALFLMFVTVVVFSSIKVEILQAKQHRYRFRGQCF